MTVRSTRLWGPTLVHNTSVTLLTVPTGFVALVKHIAMVNDNAATIGYKFRLNGTTDSANIFRNGIAGTGSAQWRESWFWVLNEGDVLRAITDNASDITIAGFGALLEL